MFLFLCLKHEVLNLFAWLFGYELKFLNLHELGLLNLKFILVRKAKFSPKFNYIDFIFFKNLSVVVKKFLSDRAYWI